MNPLDYPYIKLVHRSEEEKKMSQKKKKYDGKNMHTCTTKPDRKK